MRLAEERVDGTGSSLAMMRRLRSEARMSGKTTPRCSRRPFVREEAESSPLLVERRRIGDGSGGGLGRAIDEVLAGERGSATDGLFSTEAGGVASSPPKYSSLSSLIVDASKDAAPSRTEVAPTSTRSTPKASGSSLLTMAPRSTTGCFAFPLPLAISMSVSRSAHPLRSRASAGTMCSLLSATKRLLVAS